MKKSVISLLLGMCMLNSVSGAELLLEITPEGKVQTTQFRQTAPQNLPASTSALSFDGKESILSFTTPKPGKGFMDSFTFIADVTFNAFAPAKKQSVIVHRVGYNNVLSVDFNGHAVASCWYITKEGKKAQLRIWSRRKLKLNRPYQLASITESRPDGTIHSTLLLDGLIEAEKTVTGKLYPYGTKLNVGKIPGQPDGFNGILKSLKIYNGALTVKEIIGE